VAIVAWLLTAGRQTVQHGLAAPAAGVAGIPTTTATPSPTAPPTTTAPPAASVFSDHFADDFSDQLSGWGEVADAKGSFGYDHSTYRITIDQPNRGTFVSAPWDVPDAVTVEVDATKISAGLGSFGLACRHGGGLRYSALIDINTTWRITRIDSPGAQPRRLAAGTSSVVQRNGTNHVAFECKGASAHSPVDLTLYVNGQKVGHVVDDDGLGTGRVGVEVASGTEPVGVAFDDIVAGKP